MRQTLQGLKPRIDRLSYLKTGNRIRTAIINETGHCDISEDVIQGYMDKKAEQDRPKKRHCQDSVIGDHIAPTILAHAILRQAHVIARDGL